MNARKFLNVRVSLTVTALALSGAMAFSSMTTSCAGDGGTGGSGGGSGGSAGGAAGGSTGTGTCTPGADSVCFSAGQASGLMSGFGWIALGQYNTATEPVCDNTENGGTASETITKDKPCPEQGGKTVWTDADQGLCITGKVPKVGNKSDGTPDYTGYWGLQVGANVDTSSGTIDISKYSKVSFNISTSAITPAPTGLLRGEIHVKDHVPADESFCAVIQAGKDVSLTSFNTECWTGGNGVAITADELKKVDKIGVQISSDETNDYTVANFCWMGATFSN